MLHEGLPVADLIADDRGIPPAGELCLELVTGEPRRPVLPDSAVGGGRVDCRICNAERVERIAAARSPATGGERRDNERQRETTKDSHCGSIDANAVPRSQRNEALHFRLSGDSDIAADAAQEAFVRLILHEQRSGCGAPREWLYTVATRLVLEEGRTHARRACLLDRSAAQVPVGQAPPDAQAVLEREEQRRAVIAALVRLAVKERTALLMQQEGFTHREIAGAVDTTTGSVGTLLARALDKLAAALSLDLDFP